MSKEMFRRSEEVRDIEFSINGTKHVVSDKFPPSTTLNDYIRDVAGLKGTKIMCKEAGCGCCVVTVTHASNGSKADTMSINSCVCPLYSVDGWQITTVEGLGNTQEGLHPIQERLARYNGSQCGYCSPGFVMSMYGLLHQQPEATQQEIEDSLDGNICRCTGYRPILDAMRSFGSDSTSGEKPMDIEDLNKSLCPKTGQPCKSKLDTNMDNGALPRSLDININGTKWYRPTNLKELTEIMNRHVTHHVKLFYGNTASGIFKHEGPFEVYIDLHAVHEIHVYQESDKEVTLGAGTTLTKLKEYLKGLQNKAGFHYCEKMIKHLKFLASVPVRNAGCIAGNLMIKHAHNEFPSDLFTIMEAVGATVDVIDAKSTSSRKLSSVPLLDFLKLDMKNKVLVSLKMPKWNSKDFYRSFKITPRSQNAHAYVNAAFKIPHEKRKITSKPSIVFGGISAKQIHAEKTEAFLKGKELNQKVIQEALNKLHKELDPSNDPLLASPKYRKDLATNLLFKTLLEVYKPSQTSLQSGADSLERPLSTGIFTFQEKPEEFPMKEPLPKKTAIFQTAGEAQYINDMPTFQHELTGAFVTTRFACGSIKDVDTTEALKIPGVIKYIGSKDLPEGYVNDYYPVNPFLIGIKEEVFVSRDFEYEGQAIGVILAETMALAEEGARRVKVTYENLKQPIMNLEEAIAKNSKHEGKHPEAKKGDTEEALKACAHVVQGEVNIGTQYHFFMENQAALAVKSEDGIDVYTAHQFADLAQSAICQVLNKPKNYCNVIVPRLGGGFGGKAFHASAIAATAAIGAELTKRPVRILLDLSTCMKMTEKRFPIRAKYRAGCDTNGKMQAVDIDVYMDSGSIRSPLLTEMLHSPDQAYYAPNWRIQTLYMKTNKSMSGPCRGPGALPGVMVSEAIMEHMAKELNQNPIMLKEMNLYQTGQTDFGGNELKYCSLTDLWNRLKQTAEVTPRIAEINNFNKNNMWRKRGINMTAVKYVLHYIPGGLPTSVSIFAEDGSVTVNTSGVEMGQGLHMKVAQAVASTLDVPLQQVKVRPNNNNFLPNAGGTGGSTTSERCVRSAIAASTKIKEGLQPLKEKMSGSSWTQILTAAVYSNIPLFATVDSDTPGNPFKYCTFMVAVNETEIDVLTGEFQVKRVDIMADFGESLNPMVDLGQVQGAFVHGLGAYTTEDVLYDQNNGRLLNDGTWEYKPPTTKDIPIDWRIHFLPDNPNSDGILGSKATGEPPIGLSASAVLSIKSIMEDVRQQLTSEKICLNACIPFTVEKIQQTANIGLGHLNVSV